MTQANNIENLIENQIFKISKPDPNVMEFMSEFNNYYEDYQSPFN